VQAAFWLHKAADQGDDLAPKYLAQIYASGGHGVTKENNQAGYWTTRAAALGKPIESIPNSNTGQTIATLLAQTAINLQQGQAQRSPINKQAIATALGEAIQDQNQR
jgi:TPR repeat protein